MKIERSFMVADKAKSVRAQLAREETLLGLFPQARPRVLARDGDRLTVSTEFRALGRSGEATFHFDVGDGNVSFEKVCDGNIWKQLEGDVSAAKEGKGQTRVTIRLRGKTKALVPEVTIKVPMEMQIDEMVSALSGALDPQNKD